MPDLKHGLESTGEELRKVQYTVSAAAGLASLLWPPARKLWRGLLRVFTGVFTGPTQRDRIEKRMTAIEAELKPNGGSSLRDKVDELFALLVINTRMTREGLSHDLCFQTDAQGSQIWTSPAFLNLIQRGQEDMAGVNWLDAIDADDRQRVETEFAEAVRRHLPYRAKQKYRIGNTMQTLRTEVEAKPMIDAAGKIIGYLGRVRTLDSTT